MYDNLITIAICDDIVSDRTAIKCLCDDFLSSLKLKAEFFEYASGLSFLEGESSVDILFLDVELGDMNGIDVMKQLENKKNVWKIIFTTSHADYMPDAFGSRTLGFLVKPVIKYNLEKCLSLAIKELLLISQPTIPIPGHNSVALSEIVYIESSGSYYYLIMVDTEKIICSGSVTKFIDSLNSFLFVCINKGTYVNLYHVVGNTDCSVTLSNGETKPLRSSYKDVFMSKLTYYIRNFRR